MKRCPDCYAIMRETKNQGQVHGLPQPDSEEAPVNGGPRVGYECSQCGHFEDAIPPLNRSLA